MLHAKLVSYSTLDAFLHPPTFFHTKFKLTIKYFSHVRGGASSTALSLPDRVQRKAVRLINVLSLVSNRQSLAHRRAVTLQSPFHHYHFGFRY